MPDLTALAQMVDGWLGEPVVVIGSLPERASDLDLLARPSTAAVLRPHLRDHGFTSRDDTWFRMNGGRPWIVDLLPADDYGLSDALAGAIFDDAIPLDGFACLRRPAPHHELLLLARRLVPVSRPLEPKRLHRINKALDEDLRAWERAAEGAGAEYAGAVAALRRSFETGAIDPRHRAAPMRAKRQIGRWLGRGRGAIVAVSGVDGAGKSTQTKVLAAALRGLGYETEVAWTRITFDPRLDRFAGPVKAAIARSRRPAAPGRAEADATVAVEEAAESLRTRSRVVGSVWVAVVAVLDGLALRRTTRPHVRRGVVVIRDRYAIDSVVQLFDKYGSRHELQARLITLLAPRPRAAFLLDVPASTAWTRKPEEYDIGQLDRHRSQYLDRVGQLGVAVLDADRPPDDVSTDLVLQVWDRLR